MSPTEGRPFVVAEAQIEVGGLLIGAQMPLSDYVQYLGRPDRSEQGPAPYGYRNNIFHYYDDLGLFLLEDFRTDKVSEITAVLDPDLALRKTGSPYQGLVTVMGYEIRRGMTEAQCAIEKHTPLRRFLAGTFSYRSEAVYVCVHFARRKAPRGKTRARAVAEVSASPQVGRFLPVQEHRGDEV